MLSPLLPLLSVVFQGSYVYSEHRAGRTPIFDLNGISLQPPVPRANAGVPCGGMGGGAIGRGARGEFRRWSLSPGRYRHTVVHANQFSVRLSSGGDEGGCPAATTAVLSSEPLGEIPASLSSWSWGSDPKIDLSSRSTYHALFPRSWTVHKDPTNCGSGVSIVSRQISPFLPNNYSDTSLPCCVFEIEVVNGGDKDQEVSVMFTFANNDGGDGKDEEEHSKIDRGSGAPRRRSRSFSSVEDIGGGGDGGAVADAVGVAMRHSRWKKVAFQDNSVGAEGATAPQQLSDPTCVCAPSLLGDGFPASSYEEKVSFAVAALKREGVSISAQTSFDPENKDSASALWSDFSSRGELREKHFGDGAEGASCDSRGAQASAVCQKLKVKAGETGVVTFSLSWDSALAMFGSGKGLPRRHTLFFPEKASGGALNASAIAAVALTKYMDWEKEIDAWQAPFLDDEVRAGWSRGMVCKGRLLLHVCVCVFLFIIYYYSCCPFLVVLTVWCRPLQTKKKKSLPSWFKSQLFNELYYLTDGGCVWVNESAEWAGNASGDVGVRGNVMARDGVGETPGDNSNVSVREAARQAIESMRSVNESSQDASGDPNIVGTFMYLEGHEYIMYNTSDVHFYASFALSRNFPQVQMSIMRGYALSVFSEDGEVRKLLGDGSLAARKVRGAVVHDMGSPCEMPIKKVNAYNFQDVSRWKDLPSKFVLMAVRDAEVEREQGRDGAKFLGSVWPAMVCCMERASNFCAAGTEMIVNGGFPDQTYDVWIASGVSAYTGGLWVAALLAMEKAARMVGDMEASLSYKVRGASAKAAYNQALWNGSYYSYSTGVGSVMADQMCGQWWSRVCGVASVCDDDFKAYSSLERVHECNVVGWSRIAFEGSKGGAVNGMKSASEEDGSCMQSSEVWTGTTYAVASAMLGESRSGRRGEEESRNLRRMAFETARGVQEMGWKKLGYAFATPEAWDRKGRYRSLGYMRPLCIWGMV